MSSTVGYGIEITGTAFGKPVEQGEFELLVGEKYPTLTVTRSRAEYGDKERIFVFITRTVREAGKDNTAIVIDASPASTIEERVELLGFIQYSEVTVKSRLNWYLVDYYVYS
jgi:hypothetical protein